MKKFDRSSTRRISSDVFLFQRISKGLRGESRDHAHAVAAALLSQRYRFALNYSAAAVFEFIISVFATKGVQLSLYPRFRSHAEPLTWACTVPLCWDIGRNHRSVMSCLITTTGDFLTENTLNIQVLLVNSVEKRVCP